MLVKFEQNRMVQTTQYFELFDKKKKKKNKNKNKNKKTKKKKPEFFLKTILRQNFDTILEDVFVAETIA